MMNGLPIALLLIVVLLLTVRRESYSEIFGFSGWSKPNEGVILDDPVEDISKYRVVDTKIDNDTIERLVLATNKAIKQKTGVCNYIIETTSIKKFVERSGDKQFYRAMFMAVKNNGFAFGFAVTVDAEIVGDVVTIKSLRTQPIDADIPNDIKPFTDGEAGQDFIEYKLVKEKAMPTRSEFEAAKNKFR
jgi:hypothetical protein